MRNILPSLLSFGQAILFLNSYDETLPAETLIDWVKGWIFC